LIKKISEHNNEKKYNKLVFIPGITKNIFYDIHIEREKKQQYERRKEKSILP
jgi:hypothetical protein